MKKKLYVFAMIAALLGSMILTGCGAEKQEEKTAAAPQKELFISAAASLTDVMKELAADYEKANPNVKVTLNFASSGALQKSIEQGAPSDLFFSAAQRQMNTLEKAGELEAGTRKDLLLNEVVLIVPKDSKADINSFNDVTTDKVKRIALGEPKGVPVGQYSEEVFTSMNCLDAVKAKAAYGTDVRQVLTWVETGEVDCGIVYATDAAISTKVRIAAKAPEGSHKPIIYPAAILKGSKNKEDAAAFLAFISKPEMVKIFEKYGFQVK
ncbi:MAG: molybdate ABC transporter substrate-binding protein [Selenomonadaceae bacterium]